MGNEELDIDIDDDDGVLEEGGPLDEPLIVSGDGFEAVVTQAEAPVVASEADLDALFGEDEEEEDLGDDDLDLDDDVEVADPGVVLDHAFELPEREDARVDKLEKALQELAGAEVTREQRRVRRKVTAATSGAGAVGFIPILLQLTGALDLDPEVASAVAAAAAALGALLAGYLTPERQAPLSPQTAAELLKRPD